MPLEVRRYSLGGPPSVLIERGPHKGEVRPRHEVVLPGWDDIIHVRPKSSLSDVEREEYFSRLFRSISRSPTPDVARNLAKIAQQIDNVQDAAVTLSVVGRVIAKFTTRLNPIIGPIATIADALNMVNILYPATLSKRAVGAGSRAGAVLSGRKRYLMKREVKRALGGVSDGNLRTYLRRLQETVKTGKVGFGFGEALQILQTSDEITGVGLSLGPIFGGIQDSFWGFLRGARFDVTGPVEAFGGNYSPDQLDALQRAAPDVYDIVSQAAPGPARRIYVDWPGVFPQIDKLHNRPVGTFERDLEVVFGPPASLLVKEIQFQKEHWAPLYRAAGNAAARVWDASKWLVGLREDLPWDVHAELLVYQSLALQVIKPFLQQADWGADLRAIAERAAPLDVLPFIGSTGGMSNGDVAAALRTRCACRRFDWVEEAPAGDARNFCVALINSFATEVMQSFEGDSVAIEEDSGTWFRAVWLMHEFDLLPPYQRDGAEVESYTRAVVSLLELSDGDLPSYGAVLGVYRNSFPGVEAES